MKYLSNCAKYLLTIFGFFNVWMTVVNGLDCPHPATDINSKVSVPSLTPGSVATYSCDKGYTLFGSTTTTCSADGKWAGERPLCATNIAVGRPVNQSSIEGGSEANFANDGQTLTTSGGGKCAKTRMEPSPWWSIDLLQEYEVSILKIMTDCCGQQPVQDLEIRIGSSTNFQRNRLCTWYPGSIEEGTSQELKCNRPMKGRYVFIQMVGVEAAMSLCEVQIFSQHEFSMERCSENHPSSNIGMFNKTCYEFQIKYGGAFDLAREHCQEYGGDLAQNINHRFTQHYLSSELEKLKPDMKTTLLWIGATKESSTISRTWNWLDGGQIKRPRWGKDQPNNYNGKQNCVVLDRNDEKKLWFWNDVGCDLNYLHWICQFRPPICGSPDKHENSTVEVVTVKVPNSKKVYSNAFYRCPEGHQVIGTENRTCDGGFWSDDPPMCKYVDCGEPVKIDHGSYVLLDERSTYGSKVLYQCADNYTIDGADTLTCGGIANSWTPSVPQCLFSWCPEITSPSNGKLESTGRRVGDTATFTCDSGHKLMGYTDLTCVKGGSWSEKEPTCRYIDCKLPLDLENGSMTLVNSSTSLHSMAKYECGPDYVLDGPPIRVCQENEQWSGIQPVCKLIECGEPAIPEEGYVTGTSLTVHSQIENHCDPGSFLTGDIIRVCTRASIWSGEVPTCTYVDCHAVKEIKFGEVIYNNHSTHLDSVITYKCNEGYYLEGVSSRTCQREGVWSGDTSKCLEIRCGDLNKPENSRTSVTKTDRRYISSVLRGRQHKRPDNTYKIGAVANYKCERGYVIEGTAVRTCRGDGTWSGQPPLCNYVDCGMPPSVENGFIALVGNATHQGSSVNYHCNTGWRVNPRGGRRYCQDNGQWSGEPYTCRETTCPSLISNLVLDLNNETSVQYTINNEEYTKSLGDVHPLLVDEGSRKVDTVAKFSCTIGKELIGDATRICQNNGIWSGSSPRCEWVSCTQPEEITNGRVIRQSETLNYGSVVEYLCFPKYHLSGRFNRTCTQDGTWSGEAPRCRLDTIDYGVLPDNTLDGASNSGRRGDASPGVQHEATNTGMYVGIAVSLILALLVGLGLVFFKTRQKKMAKSDRQTPPLKSQQNPAMSYADLSDPSTGNNIYENISEDTATYANTTSTEPSINGYSTYSSPVYSNGSSHTYSNREEDPPTLTNQNSSSRIPYNMAQRPRMPPPQPPTVPDASVVTINGVSVASS